MQERRNSIANAMELRLSCTNPSKWSVTYQAYNLKYNCNPRRFSVFHKLSNNASMCRYHWGTEAMIRLWYKCRRDVTNFHSAENGSEEWFNSHGSLIFTHQQRNVLTYCLKCLWSGKISWCNVCLPSSNKPLPQRMVTGTHDAVWCR